MSIAYCECVFVALVIRQTKRMQYTSIIQSSVICLAVPYISTSVWLCHTFPHLSGCAIHFHIVLTQGTIFEKEENILFNMKVL
jgi:hypothetical protein